MTQGSKLKLKANEQLGKCPCTSDLRPRKTVPQASLLETHQGSLVYFPLRQPWVEAEASGKKVARRAGQRASSTFSDERRSLILNELRSPSGPLSTPPPGSR